MSMIYAVPILNLNTGLAPMLVSMNISVDMWVNGFDFTVPRMIWASSDFGILYKTVNHVEENIINSLVSVLFSNSSIGLFWLENFIFYICFIIESYIWPWKYSAMASVDHFEYNLLGESG